MRSFVLAGLLCGAVALAQTASPSGNQTPSNHAAASATAAPAKTAPSTPAKAESAKKESVKAESVTINMPEGMTKDQADAILNELKAIHQLLQSQQNTRAAAAPPPAAAPQNDKVTMSVGQGWYAIGRADAPVTMVEFTDYQCPFCRKFESDSFAQIKKEYIDTGKVRFVSRDLPLDFHPNAPAAAMAARCAGDQGKFWQIRDAMMLDSATDLGPDALIKYGEKVSLDMTSYRTCLSDKKYTEDIKKDSVDAGKLGISGTPSFVIGKTDKAEIAGVRIVGAVPYAVFESAIKDALAAK
ncbi:MAG TPA: thioredoxin domain-containing protein [Candidatus Binatia bacterium]|nr:thioredoxin domain-containing protein [Candidatus Binatia bacterium]